MDQTFYFFVYFPRTKKLNDKDIKFIEPKDENQIPECIYSVEDEEYEAGTFHYKNIYKAAKVAVKGKKSNTYNYQFLIDEDIYIISFSNKGNSTFTYLLLPLGSNTYTFSTPFCFVAPYKKM